MKISTIATFAILLATFLWGMTFAFIKDAVTSLDVFNFLFWRFGVASLILFCISYKKIKFSDRKLLLQGFLLGLFLAGTVIFQSTGLRYTSASTASFITGMTVIIVALIVCCLERRWPTFNVILAVILAVTGIGLITLTSSLTINVGDLWVMLCAFCFATYIILAGKFSHSGEPITLTFVQMMTIFIIVGSINFSSNNFTVPNATHLWISILFCAIFASIIAFILQLRFQRYVTSTKTAIIFASEPIFATITAIIYLGEQLTLKFVIGALLIFSAMLLSELKSKKKVMPQD